MPHVFRFGPVSEPDEPVRHAYVVLDDAGENSIAGSFAATDAEGLAAVRAEVEGPLTCDAELQAAGAPLGITASDGPHDAAMWRLAMPLSFLSGPDVETPEVELLLAFARAGTAFDQANPSLQPRRGHPFALELTGAVTVSQVGILHGDEGSGGLTLVKDREAFDRMERLIFAGLSDDAARLGLLMASFEAEPPPFLAPTLASLGARGVMCPRQLGHEDPTIAVEQVWALAAALQALSQVGDRVEHRTRLELSGGDGVDVTLRFLEWDFSFALAPKARA